MFDTLSERLRGALNNLLQIAPAQRALGVCSASGGNHGVALAYAAWRLGCPATIYIPERASADREARMIVEYATTGVFAKGTCTGTSVVKIFTLG